jgi:hypothetical protein
MDLMLSAALVRPLAGSGLECVAQGDQITGRPSDKPMQMRPAVLRHV